MATACALCGMWWWLRGYMHPSYITKSYTPSMGSAPCVNEPQYSRHTKKRGGPKSKFERTLTGQTWNNLDVRNNNNDDGIFTLKSNNNNNSITEGAEIFSFHKNGDRMIELGNSRVSGPGDKIRKRYQQLLKSLSENG